jgi:hypothetical protein
LWPDALPTDVDNMRPSQLAAVLGLDEYEAVQPVPFPKELLDQAERVERIGVPRPASQPTAQRVRRLVGGD